MVETTACRVCLAMEVMLYPLINTDLYLKYLDIIGINSKSFDTLVKMRNDGKPHYICYECKYQLTKYVKFKEKCIRADEVMSELLTNRIEITPDTIKMIDRQIYNLATKLVIVSPETMIECCPNPTEYEIKYEELNFNYENISYYDSDKGGSEDDVPLKRLANEVKRDIRRNSAVKKTKEKDVPESKYVEITIDNAVAMVKDEISEHLDYINGEEAMDDDMGVSNEDDLPLREDYDEKEKVHKGVKKKLRPRKKIETVKEGTRRRGGFKEDYAEEIYLTVEEQKRAMHMRSLSLNYINSPLKCCLCYKGFIDKVAYNNHLERHNKSTGAYECEICHLRYSMVQQLRTHLVTSHRRQYACKKCMHRSHTANQAREHEKWHKGYIYQCQLCSAKFQKATTHLTHMRISHPTEFICQLCGKSFVGKHGLMMHKTKTHRSKKVNEVIEKKPESYCTDCDVQFASVEAWKRHITTSIKHTNDISCKICKLVFSESNDMTKHMKGHIKEDQVKRSDQNVNRSALKRLSCDQCGAKFVTKSQVLVHIKRLHLGLKYNKNIVCEVCGKKCSSNATLKYHQRTHTGEKPYTCTVCMKKFSDNTHLKIHNRIHTNERPYSCELCGKSFRQKASYNRHTRVHTGIKPFECQLCFKTFTQSNSLKLHIKTVHLKLPSNRRCKNQNATQNIVPIVEKSLIDKSDIDNPIILQCL